MQRRDSVYSERGVSVAPVRGWGEASVDESMQYGGKRVLLFVMLRSKMSAVGFEPTSPKTLRPERNPLDHSGKLTRRYLHLSTTFNTFPQTHTNNDHNNNTHTKTAKQRTHLTMDLILWGQRALAQTHRRTLASGIWLLQYTCWSASCCERLATSASLRAVSARCSVIR